MGSGSSRRRAAVILTLSTTLLWPLSAPGESPAADLDALERAFVELARVVSPAVVAIETERRPGARPDGEDRSGLPMLGSGVVIEADGLILTNDHVISDAQRIFVTLHSGRRHEAHVVGRDERSDLAVVRIDSRSLVPATRGDVDEVRVGQFAFAMGNPFGIGRDGRSSFSFGVISALGRSLRSLEAQGRRYYGNLIQTTADIHPGNSGGPLFDIRGRLIGINTAIETRSGVGENLGYAIPLSARTKDIIRRLASGQDIEYGFLGIQIVDPPESALRRAGSSNPWGVMVEEVIPGTPAHAADIRQDDLILRYASQPVRSADHFIRMVGATPVGEQVSMVICRGRRELTVQATVAERQLRLAGAGE